MNHFSWANSADMKIDIKTIVFLAVMGIMSMGTFLHHSNTQASTLQSEYTERMMSLRDAWLKLLRLSADDNSRSDVRDSSIHSIHATRFQLKRVDFWLRYFDPLAYKALNAPLPVEYETEVFEKYESPYRRVGAGLTLMETYLQESGADTDSLLQLGEPGLQSLEYFVSDSILQELNKPHNFYFANRLFLMNLAAIYTTGFDNPAEERVLTELNDVIVATGEIYASYNRVFDAYKLNEEYEFIYSAMGAFVKKQPSFDQFDHFTFIRNFIIPLYRINQKAIKQFGFTSTNMIDFAINDNVESFFSKTLFKAQSSRGIFESAKDQAIISDIADTGRLLFYDPVLSGNSKRSCAGCHNPQMYFADTTRAVALAFNGIESIERNAPSLLNVFHNHLLMQDGKFYQVEDQLHDVIHNPLEMGNESGTLLTKLNESKEYRQRLKRLASYTPAYSDVSERHVLSALMVYLEQFSYAEAPFDKAMNGFAEVDVKVKEGFNLFMGKAKCGTCHFVPVFNGVKPPYAGSEFEVIGVPRDTLFGALSADNGRADVFTVPEMQNAFRTGTIRNAAKTAPYMHNGVFSSLHELLQFYNLGGGSGRGLHVPNQTLPSDSLHLSGTELQSLTAFIESLTEEFSEQPPASLPYMANPAYRFRKVGGDY